MLRSDNSLSPRELSRVFWRQTTSNIDPEEPQEMLGFMKHCPGPTLWTAYSGQSPQVPVLTASLPTHLFKRCQQMRSRVEGLSGE